MQRNKTFMKSKFFSILGGGTATMIVVAILSLSDVLIAGIMLGEQSVAAVNLVVPIYTFAGFAGSMVSLGVPIIYTAAMGKFKKEEADKAFGTGFTLSVIVGISMFVLLMFFGDTYLRFYGAPEFVTELSKPYFFWYKLIILQMPLAALMIEMVIADGDENLALVSGAVQFVSNIALSFALSYVMGLEGIGVASFIGSYLGIAILLLHFFRKGSSLKINFVLSGTVIKQVAKYSVIDSGLYLFLSILAALLNKYMLWKFGAASLVLVSAIVTVKELELLFDGIGEACSPMLNIYLNEKSFGGVRKCFNFSAKVAIIEGVLLAALVAAFAPFIVSMLSIDDPESVKKAIIGIRVMSIGYVGVSLTYLLSSYYLVRKKILLGFSITALTTLIVPAVFAIGLSIPFGIYGIFTGLCIAPYIALLIGFVIIVLRYGKNNYPLIIEDMENECDSHFYELIIDPEHIIELQKKIADLLREKGRDESHIRKVKLLTEEVFVVIYEKNKGNVVLGECTVLLDDNSERIIVKDDGRLFALSEGDVHAQSISQYLIDNYMVSMDSKYLTTMSYNRNVFVVE